MKAAIGHLREGHAFSERRACGRLELAVSTYRYRPTRDDGRLREQLVELARERPRFGYRRLHAMLPADQAVNQKRVWRVYREAGLSVKRRKRKRLVRVGRPLEAGTARDEEGLWISFPIRSRAGGRSGC